nr:serine/threonine-protein phosphatase 2a activator 2 [Quercus suber]
MNGFGSGSVKRDFKQEGEIEIEIFRGGLGSTLSAPAPTKYSFGQSSRNTIFILYKTKSKSRERERERMGREVSESCVDSLLTEMVSSYCDRFYANKSPVPGIDEETAIGYCLEPAGSHGVWELDDYHFLLFIFGSSQLIDHRYMKPKSIHNDDILENFNKECLYIACIAFVKKGLFAEHSPLLDDISGVPTWNKVNSGLLKMYKVEVLEKVPIMQHFLFGWLIKCYGFCSSL